MKQNLEHTIISFLLTVVVLFPFFVQASHAFEKHEHEICTAKDIKHFHEQEFDCSIYHTPVEQQTHFENSIDSFHKTIDFAKSFSFSSQLSSNKVPNVNLTRGPPTSILFTHK